MTTLDRQPLEDLGVVRSQLPETGGIEQVKNAFLPAAKEKVAARQDRESGSAQIVVIEIQGGLVGGREEVDNAQARSPHAEFEQRIAKASNAVPWAISGREVGIASGID